MRLVKKIIISILMISIIGLQSPGINFAASQSMFARTEAGITEHAPEMLAPPEIDIPVEVVSSSQKSGVAAPEKKSNNWMYYLGGAALLGGIAAAAGGGGGGDSGSSSTSSGDITVSW